MFDIVQSLKEVPGLREVIDFEETVKCPFSHFREQNLWHSNEWCRS